MKSILPLRAEVALLGDTESITEVVPDVPSDGDTVNQLPLVDAVQAASLVISKEKSAPLTSTSRGPYSVDDMPAASWVRLMTCVSFPLRVILALRAVAAGLGSAVMVSLVLSAEVATVSHVEDDDLLIVYEIFLSTVISFDSPVAIMVSDDLDTVRWGAAAR